MERHKRLEEGGAPPLEGGMGSLPEEVLLLILTMQASPCPWCKRLPASASVSRSVSTQFRDAHRRLPSPCRCGAVRRVLPRRSRPHVETVPLCVVVIWFSVVLYLVVRAAVYRG